MSKHSKIRRYPRLPDGETMETAPVIFHRTENHPDGHFSITGKYLVRAYHGDAPKNYDRLTKVQKKIAKLLASGLSIRESCKKLHINLMTFYRWRRAHPLFIKYLGKQIQANASDLTAHHGRQVLRAVQVIDEALDMNDPYFTAQVAKDVLRGRGEWKNSSQSQVTQQIGGKIDVDTKVRVDDQGMNRDLMQTLVDGIIQIAGGQPRPKVISVEPEEPDGKVPTERQIEGSAS